MPTTLTARWIVPVVGPPLPGGTVTVEDDRIVAVEPHGRRTPDLDLGGVAVLPGLVNAHTHLDLTGLRGLAPPSPDFTGWLRRVIAHRRERSPEQIRADVRIGIEECLRFGTTLVGDIAGGGGESWDELASAPLRAVVFRELLGLTAARAGQALAAARGWLAAHPATETCRAGLSPHAPYSVRAGLFRAAAGLGVPVSVHLAETPAERELLTRHTGPFVPFLQALGVWDASGLARSPEWVARRFRRADHALVIHGNDLAPAAVPPTATVVYCPRTHAAFAHAPHPFRDFQARSVRVALGTDSLASNPDLDLLAEARFVRQHFSDVPAATILRMATLDGAAALGWADETGSLEPGKSADLVAVPIPDRAGGPCELVLDTDEPVRAVMFRGVWRRVNGESVSDPG
jgi:cytosine/adenosine deaminase-related metal-dependent hydrolase